MDYGPFARIALRYVIGGVIGMDGGRLMAGDPDLVTVAALLLGAVIETAYALARRRGWAT